MFDVSTNENEIVFVNTKTNRAEKLHLIDALEPLDAIKTIDRSIKAANSASEAAVSLLATILDNPRLDGYRGQTPVNEQIPTELKSAIRELETEYMKPLFCANLESKGQKPAAIEQAWQAYAKGLKAGGSYAMAKSKVTAYFAVTGYLPKAANGKLLTVAAIDKLMQNEREKMPSDKAESGITGKLVELSEKINSHTGDDWKILGDVPSGIAALKAMLATYEGVWREMGDIAQAKHELTSVGHVASAIISNASEQSLTSEIVALM